MTFLLILLAMQRTAFPSTSSMSWMEPAAFRLSIGMSEKQARERLHRDGHILVPQEKAGELAIEYDTGRTVTIEFRGGRLASMRFELVDFQPKMRDHWRVLSGKLRRELGAPSLTPPGTDVLIWNERSPQAMAALSMKPDDRFGRQGLGYVVVRYFEPPAAAAAGTRGASGAPR